MLSNLPHCDFLAPTSSCAAPLHPSDHLIHVRHPLHSLSITNLTFPTSSSPFHPSRSCPSHRHEQHRSTAPPVLQRRQVFESVFVCLVLIALVVPKQCAIALYNPIDSSPSLHSTTHLLHIHYSNQRPTQPPSTLFNHITRHTHPIITMSYSSILTGSPSTDATSVTSSTVDDIPSLLFDGQIKVRIVKVSSCHLSYTFKL